MKMHPISKKGQSPPVMQRASSCDEFLFLHKKNSDVGSGSSNGPWFQSTSDLPASVAECFQDTSFVGRMQNNLLVLIGRGRRYKIKTTQGCSLFSLIAARKKHDEKTLLSTKSTKCTSQSSEVSTPSLGNTKAPLKEASSLPIRSSKGLHSRQNRGNKPGTQESTLEDTKSKEGESESRFSYTSSHERLLIPTKQEESTQSLLPYKHEETLLRQYLSLQQLAIARRHCNQLRKIRDSLAGKVRPHAPQVTLPPTEEQQRLRNFLLDVGFVQYYVLLNRHGYDFVTASHMDILDLAAVGINEPLHRMALKYELDQVRPPIVPQCPIPETVAEWLQGISLPEYVEHFQQNGFYCPLAAVGLRKRDLQLMGIYMLGHRKKIILALASINLALNKKEGHTQQGS